MPAIADGTSTIVAIKKQLALGSAASGAGATAIEVRPSAGLTRQVQTIESQILHRSGFRRRARQGSESAQATYASELLVGNLDVVFAGINTQVDPAVDIDESDVTSLALATSGGVQTATVASGDLYALGLYAGRFIKLAGMSTAGNNGKWVPILSVPTNRTFTVPVGILTDQAADLAFTMSVAKTYRAAATRVKEYYSLEEYLDIDRSKLGVDQRFTGLSFGVQANQMATAEFTLAGLRRQLLDAAASPNFTSPTYGAIAGAESMTMLDGAIYINGVDILTLTSLTMGVSAQSNITPLLRSRYGLSVSVPSFGFTGQFSGVLTDDATFFEDADAETPLFIVTQFRQSSDLGSDFIGVVIPNAAYANADAPIADGDTIVNLPLYAGRETRLLTEGWPENSTLVISTSSP